MLLDEEKTWNLPGGEQIKSLDFFIEENVVSFMVTQARPIFVDYRSLTLAHARNLSTLSTGSPGESEKKLGEKVKKAGGESEKSWGRK